MAPDEPEARLAVLSTLGTNLTPSATGELDKETVGVSVVTSLGGGPSGS